MGSKGDQHESHGEQVNMITPVRQSQDSRHNFDYIVQEDAYVEFNLGGGDEPEDEPPKEVPQLPVPYQEPSQLEIPDNSSNSSLHKVLKRNPFVDLNDELGWEEMDSTNNQKIYDDKGQLLTDDHIHDRNDERNDSSFGYTRIAAEQQAEAYLNADKKTDFLFKQNLNKNSQQSVDKLYQSESGLDIVEVSDENEELNDDMYSDDYNANKTLDQLSFTKDLLRDSQKFAYVGLVKLVIYDMATNLAKWAVVPGQKSSHSKFIKRMSIAQSNFGQWQRNVCSRLYAHLDLNEDEVKMIEQLGNHGVQVSDLAKALKKTETISNPVYDKNSENNRIEEGEKSVVRPEDTTANEKLEVDVSWTVLCDLFLILVEGSTYDARSRSLFIEFAKLLDQESLDVAQFERRITDALQLEESSDQVWNERDLLKARAKKAKKKKYMYVGLATIGGSLILGLSGGLLAPVIGAGVAAGLTTIGITGTSGFLAGTGGAALVAVGSTAIGAKVGAIGMLKRVGDVKTFEFVPLHNNKRTNLIITVSGWMNGKADDIRLPFSTVDPVMGDLYSVLWEPDMLQSTGQTMNILATEALTQSIQQILGATILMGLMSAIQLPMMLSKLSYLVDNPWNVSLDRAWKAGLILADTLISRNLGVRPVTLLGFSLGSRVIYSCLLELAKRGAYGLVEKVIIFGSPVVISKDKLLLARSVVSGQFVNGYSKKDWILGYLFRATSGGLGRVAGLAPIEDIEGIENFDCTDLVQGHMGYRKAMPHLLSKLDFEVFSDEFVEIDEPDPEETENQRKLISEFGEAKKQMEEEQSKAGKKSAWFKWFKPKKKDWWEMYSESKNASKESLESEATDTVYQEPKDVFDIEKMVQNAKKQHKLKDTLAKFDESQNEGDDTVEGPSQILGSLHLAEEEDDDASEAPDSRHIETDSSKPGTGRKSDPPDSPTKQNSPKDPFSDEFPAEENIKMSFA